MASSPVAPFFSPSKLQFRGIGRERRSFLQAPTVKPRTPVLHRIYCLQTPTTTSASNHSNREEEEEEEDNLASAPGPYDLQPSPKKLEKIQKRASIIREKRRTELQKPEPPNFEIGWKRTKPINTEKPKGYVVADFVEKLEELMGRGQYGSVELLVKAGEIVVERAREEAEVLVDVNEMVMTELFRVLKLLEMDLKMVKAAVKEETRNERVEIARARCRQAISVALSL